MTDVGRCSDDLRDQFSPDARAVTIGILMAEGRWRDGVNLICDY